MTRPSRSNTRRVLCAAPILLAACTATAQETPAVADPGAPAAEAGQAPATGDQAVATGGDESAGVGEAGEATPGAPGVSVIARWVKESACRIFTELPIDQDTRFSPDKQTRARLDWRISLPSFVGARLSLTHGSAHPADLAGEPADGAAPADETAPGIVAPGSDVGAATADGAAPGAEATNAADGAATSVAEAATAPSAPPAVQSSPPPPPRLTWTQKVGLVRAPASSSQAAGAAAPELTWTQKVGLVRAPQSASGASAGSVSSFKKTAKADGE